jgi:putative ABC transport system permease protein
MSVIALSWLDILLSALPLAALAAVFAWHRLQLSRTLLIGALRTFVQLALVGFVLKGIFQNAHPVWTVGFSLVMLGTGTWEITRRQHRQLTAGWTVGLAVLGLFTAGFTVTVFALLALVGVKPWWSPQYAIPLLGMILGNTMTGIALGMDTLTLGAWRQRAVIENRLALGQTAGEAVAELKRDSMRTAMTPIINSLAVCGVVSLPGMMTGQILSGSDPLAAVRYQMMIMYLIAGGAGFGSLLTIHLAARRLFDGRERLRLDRLQAP